MNVVVGWMQKPGAAFHRGPKRTLRRRATAPNSRGTVHWLHYGQGSFRSRSRVWRPPCGEVAAEGGGGSNGSQSVPPCRASSHAAASSRTCGTAGCTGAADGCRNEDARKQAGPRRGVAAGAILQRPVAAGHWNILRADRGISVPGAMERTRRSEASDGLARSGEVLSADGGVRRLRLFCDQQLCARASPGATLARNAQSRAEPEWGDPPRQ
jgi:hypothetical protein